ncbi:MAG: iron-sulfur cluster carrier protein ApbC [Betaproteobacteria bacterium]|nr:iron-sulfur cluster carrier protein ApbC [Betaproteobacteria bacterium]NBT75820.1 iron-sulfur cluster carrier protein ApbC [Betaproteobacteria bacterium]NBY13836.1 iron-sulfur cluster carrier protein ApbC [Betaproteobacteria bacterium]NCA16093.1 iron-sulfur cluster carrier protein ApbC [Betaproteobacteria bacterium]
MSLTPADIHSELSKVSIPELGKDLISAKMLRNLKIDGGDVSFELVYGFPAKSQFDSLRKQAVAAVRARPGVENVSVTVSQEIVAHAVQRGVKPITGVKNIIAIASGKGGVGKSTTTVNLALALAAEGAKVGVLDADIYGPSIPTMLGIRGRPETKDGKSMEPLSGHGLVANSIGFLIEPGQAMVWRGPMVSQALDQLLRETNWAGLDYLLMDLPPGTGDVHLSLAQTVPITGAVIVTTPQEIATLDARKGLAMFQKVSVPVLGIIENMSLHICSNCGHQEHIFGQGGGQLMSQEYGVPLLGSLPLNISIRERADAGQPTVVDDPDGAIAGLYKGLARSVAVAVSRIAKDSSSKFPSIVVQNI